MKFHLMPATLHKSIFLLLAFLFFLSCKTTIRDSKAKVVAEYPSDIITHLDQWNLILGDGSNVGPAVNYNNYEYIYTTSDKKTDWVVFKTPNAGNTHGSSNNTRTELAQLKKWSPMSGGKLNATLKVMNVSPTGDARVAASHSVVVGRE